MCSVVGYIGNRYCRNLVFEALSRLEYRGYDSAGFACIDEQTRRLVCAKSVGQLDVLKTHVDALTVNGYTGIGHTRWSTHGVTSEINAHPHVDCMQRISLVHNGIIENHYLLKLRIQDRHHFYSDTDTEVVAHLLEELLEKKLPLKDSLVALSHDIDGAYAIVGLVQDMPGCMFAIRRRSPLCLGIGDQETFVASDAFAFSSYTNQYIFMPDESFAIIYPTRIELYNFDGLLLNVSVQTIMADTSTYEKKGYEHFMLKEIFEQKNGIYATVNHLKTIQLSLEQHIGMSLEQLNNLVGVEMIACGTSSHAARIAQSFFEEVVKIPTNVHLASEFRYQTFFPCKEKLYLFISQSGETADTLEALRMVNTHKLLTLVITNVATSSMVRETAGYLLTQAGREIAVASTKAFTTQLTVLYWFAYTMALHRGLIATQQHERACEELLLTAEVLEYSIECYKSVIADTYAPYYARYDKAIFLGRHTAYAMAMEAALKLKEIAYVFAQSYPAGELKHGPLALIEPQVPIYIFSHLDSLIYHKLLSSVQEVKARNGHVVVFAFEGQQELCNLADEAFIIPKVSPLLGPLAMTGLIQFFVYMIAKERGCPIDKPRNLAKSVTVE